MWKKKKNCDVDVMNDVLRCDVCWLLKILEWMTVWNCVENQEKKEGRKNKQGGGKEERQIENFREKEKKSVDEFVIWWWVVEWKTREKNGGRKRQEIKEKFFRNWKWLIVTVILIDRLVMIMNVDLIWMGCELDNEKWCG